MVNDYNGLKTVPELIVSRLARLKIIFSNFEARFFITEDNNYCIEMKVMPPDIKQEIFVSHVILARDLSETRNIEYYTENCIRSMINSLIRQLIMIK